ncbi:MAG: chromosome partition protein MukB [Desulfobulbus sp.]|nr:chromosome partition protein MukB [Desulfobulbus sp.]
MNTKNRAHLRRLILVNWNGFFFQSFEMDAGVTALEGENGAGKTTVMIAAFVALLPDQGLLRFRNAADAGGTGEDRGIYGRLAAKGVSYSFLDIVSPKGKRILAGVLLRRKTAPGLEITPFLAEDLPEDAVLENTLLVRQGETVRIPELADLRQSVHLAGGALTVCETVGQYTARLFELGITPMSMEAPAERDKFNRMLQTSMYGGLSSSIQKGLRSYLLAEDPTLRNHVARMRENLESCRLTRQEIEKAANNCTVIEGLFQSGYRMFEAAFHGTRLRVAGLRSKAESGRYEHYRNKAELVTRQRQRDELTLAHSEAVVDLQLRTEEHERATEVQRKRVQAFEIATRIKQVEICHTDAANTLEKRDREFRAREQISLECVRQRDRLLAEKEEIAGGLANAQQAWENVDRKVALYRQARATLDDCRTALPKHEVTEGNAEALLAECRKQWNEALENKVRVERELDVLNTRVDQFHVALQALSRTRQQEVEPERASASAAELEREVDAMERTVRDAGDLPARIQKAEKLAERQGEVRRKTTRLMERGERIESAETLRSRFDALCGEQDALASGHTTLLEQLARCGQERYRLEQQQIGLRAEADGWRTTRDLAQKLGNRFAATITNDSELESVQKTIEEGLAEVGDHLRQLDQERKTTRERKQELEFGCGQLDESLVQLRDLVEGNLVAELYEQTPEKEATLVEARLGPLHGALLVDNIPAAVDRILQQADRPEEIWLLEPGALTEIPAGISYDNAELVAMGDAWRLTAHPQRPVVGRAARESEIKRLEIRMEQLDTTREIKRDREAWLLEGKKILDQLSRHWNFLGAPDPTEALNRLTIRLKEVKEEELDAKHRAGESEHRRGAVQTLLRIFNDCLPDADLLDDRDWAEELKNLHQQRKDSLLLQQRLETLQPDLEIVRASQHYLSSPPPRPEAVETINETLARADDELTYWMKGKELLTMVVDRLSYFAYRDQEILLTQQGSALDALKKDLDRVDLAWTAAKREVEQVAPLLETARKAFEDARAALLEYGKRLESLREELTSTGEEGSQQSLEEAARLEEETKKRLDTATASERRINNDLIGAGKDVEFAAKEVEHARDGRRKALSDLRPHWRHWMHLRRDALRQHCLDRLMDGPTVRAYDPKGHPAAFQESSGYQGELKRILHEVPDGKSLWREVEQVIEFRDADMRRGLQTLTVWFMIRRFLERSIPRDISQADDPELALHQIKEHLHRLRGRLEDQENQLRHGTDTVANSIRTRIRREEYQMQRLNKGLATVHFGTITGIRIQLTRVEAMHRLLESLKKQMSLFDSRLPLEEALVELYRQVGGGQVKGDQLLDYREYVQLRIEIRRHGSEKWSPASSGTISTGESIGVGTAVLMVILDAWETQSALLRGKRDGGSLRFLFLDEAARLSPRSLDALAELCDRMDMQLLVAAPAADRARRGTAYRLVRVLDVHNEEEVVVRGRRFTGEKAEV